MESTWLFNQHLDQTVASPCISLCESWHWGKTKHLKLVWSWEQNTRTDKNLIPDLSVVYSILFLAYQASWLILFSAEFKIEATKDLLCCHIALPYFKVVRGGIFVLVILYSIFRAINGSCATMFSPKQLQGNLLISLSCEIGGT